MSEARNGEARHALAISETYLRRIKQKRLRVLVPFVGLGMLTGCSADSISSHPENSTIIPVGPGWVTGSIYSPTYAGMTVSFNTTSRVAEVEAAVARWNDAFANVNAAPILLVNASAVDVALQLHFDETTHPNGQYWCGSTQTFIRVDNSSSCPIQHNNLRTDLVGLLTHEIGNNIGWNDLEGFPDSLPMADTVLRNCVMNANFTNSHPCGYERQWLLYIHGNRGFVDLNEFMVDAAYSTLSDDTLVVGESAWMGIEYEPLDGGGVFVEPPQALPSLPPSWTRDHGSVVTISNESSSGASINAVGVGTTTVRLTLSTSDPTVAWHSEGPIQTSKVITVIDADPPVEPPDPPAIASIELSTYSVALGAPNPHSVDVYGIARDSAGTIILGATFTWVLTPDAKGEPPVWVNDQGSYVTLTNRDPGGTAILKATSGGVQSTAASVVVDCKIIACP